MVNFFCYSAAHCQFYNMWCIDGNASFLCYVLCFWNFVNDNWTEFSNSKVESRAGRSREKVLDWPTRYRIAAGAARGISYLHHDCIPHIIHRDIKSSNILLDQNMDARVSDFGLATLMQPNKTHVSTIVAGTFGYLAPGIDTTWLNTQFLHFTLLMFKLMTVFACRIFWYRKSNTERGCLQLWSCFAGAFNWEKTQWWSIYGRGDYACHMGKTGILEDLLLWLYSSNKFEINMGMAYILLKFQSSRMVSLSSIIVKLLLKATVKHIIYLYLKISYMEIKIIKTSKTLKTKLWSIDHECELY